MDVLLLLALAIGLIYCLYRLARWARRIGLPIWTSGEKSQHRKRKTEPGDKAIDDIFFAIIRPIWKRPTDEHDPG